MDESEPDAGELEPKTEPFAPSLELRERAVLLAQVAQQLTHSDPIEPLPRARAPRSTTDLDDEVTNIVPRPGGKPAV